MEMTHNLILKKEWEAAQDGEGHERKPEQLMAMTI